MEWRKKLRINSYACFGSKVASYIAEISAEQISNKKKKREKRRRGQCYAIKQASDSNVRRREVFNARA